MPLLVTCWSLSRLIRHCFWSWWTCPPVSVEMLPLWLKHMYFVLSALTWRPMPSVARSRLCSRHLAWVDVFTRSTMLFSYWPGYLLFSTSHIILYFHSLSHLILLKNFILSLWKFSKRLFLASQVLLDKCTYPSIVGEFYDMASPAELLFSVLCFHMLHSALLPNYLASDVLTQQCSQHRSFCSPLCHNQ